MITNNIYNFLFHPLSESHSTTKKIYSIITICALSALTGAIFAVAFLVVNLRDRQITKKEETKIDNIVSPVLKKSFSISQDKTIEIQAKVETPPTPLLEETSPIPEKKKGDQAKIDRIKEAQSKQVDLFEKWAEKGQWNLIHKAHYDWWMFPVERPSDQYKDFYAVAKEEVEVLKADHAFMESYKRGVVLVVLAWGWDLENDGAIVNPAKDQKWYGYCVRLGKMSDSLRLFGETNLHRKLQLFFKQHCLSQQDRIPISKPDMIWLKGSLLDIEDQPQSE